MGVKSSAAKPTTKRRASRAKPKPKVTSGLKEVEPETKINPSLSKEETTMASTQQSSDLGKEDALLEEMIHRAQSAGEPGTSRPGSVLESAGEGIPPSIVGSVKSAGYVHIWDTRTGEKSVTNRNMLPTQLKKVREDGSRVFTTIDPRITPRRGTLKCLLHPSGDNRAHYDELGLAACRKSNLVSPFQVSQHMKTRHPAEWATLEQERIDSEKREEREFQRALIDQARK